MLETLDASTGCVDACTTDADCRQADGYRCFDGGADGRYCRHPQTGDACGQGGWQGWDQNDDVCGEITTDEANSVPNSLRIVGSVPDPFGDDMVHQFSGLEGGAWTPGG